MYLAVNASSLCPVPCESHPNGPSGNIPSCMPPHAARAGSMPAIWQDKELIQKTAPATLSYPQNRPGFQKERD